MKTKRTDIPYCGCDRQKIYSAVPKLNYENMQLLHKYIVDRYTIHIKKDVKKMEPPWVDEAVMQSYRFCNVFREDDRVTRSLITQVSENPFLIYEEKILNTILFRAWNNPKTFHDLGGPWSAEDLYDPELKESVRPIYDRFKSKNPDRKWFNAAFNQGGLKYSLKYPNGKGMGAHEEEGNKSPGFEPEMPLRIFHLGPLMRAVYPKLIKAKDQQEAYLLLKTLPGFAAFYAYQVFVDLTYIKEFPFSENEFVIAGPGCKRGLNCIFDDYDGLSPEEALFWLRNNIDGYFTATTGDGWDPKHLFYDRLPSDRCLNVMALENCMCELSKYIRAVKGTGRPKERYIIGRRKE